MQCPIATQNHVEPLLVCSFVPKNPFRLQTTFHSPYIIYSYKCSAADIFLFVLFCSFYFYFFILFYVILFLFIYFFCFFLFCFVFVLRSIRKYLILA